MQLTDNDLPEESSQRQFRSRRERREYERSRRAARQVAGGDTFTDEGIQAEPSETEEPSPELDEEFRPQPLAADGPGGLQEIPRRPVNYSSSSAMEEPHSRAHDTIRHDRVPADLPEFPEDIRTYPKLSGTVETDSEDGSGDTPTEENPLGYMLVGEGMPLPEIDEEEVKTRKTRKRRRTIVMLTSFAVFLGLLAIVGIGVGQLVGWNNKDFPGPGGEEVAFEVKPGEGPIVIGNRLVEENIVASTRAFRDAVEASDTTAQIQPGDYTLRYEMPARDAAEVLLGVGVPGMNYVHVNSGHRIDDVFAHIAERTDYTVEEIEEAADPTNFEVPAEAATLEGYIAVGEYHFPLDASIQEILEIMIEPTIQEFDRLGVTDGAEQHRLVTVASILEAEARPEDFALVAGIIENRLDRSNPETAGFLQIDATVIYGMGVRQLQFSADDRHDASNEYNTYVHRGLPPGPIGAPSIDALDAAAAPKDSDYYYWITTNIETGETKFSSTYEQHQGYQQEYRAYCDDNPEICGRG
ncbi:hypothetical protein GCM10022249_08630 [Enteractinococcus coprophilus]